MIDDLDRKIVRALNQNARKSFRDVAKEVDSSVTAVINRVKKLEESGFIRGYIPLVEPECFGLNLIAIIALRISKGKLLETQKKSLKIQGWFPFTISPESGTPWSLATSKTDKI